MLSKTYNIINLQKTGSLWGESDVVRKIKFGVTGSEYNVSATLELELTLGQHESGSFTSFSELSEGKVISWITGSHPENIYDNQIRQEIEKKRDSIISGSSLPWNS